MLDNVLKWMGAGDAAISAMGPLLTIALAWLFGGALTQWAKFPLSRWISNKPVYDWTVRTLAVVATTAFAHLLSEALPWPLEIGVGVSQAIAYRVFIAVAQRRWPELASSALVGSIDARKGPP